MLKGIHFAIVEFSIKFNFGDKMITLTPDNKVAVYCLSYSHLRKCDFFLIATYHFAVLNKKPNPLFLPEVAAP